MDYRISRSPLTNVIYAGRVNKDGTAFTSKTDQTMEAMLAVADLVLQAHNGEVELTSPDEAGYRITVEKLGQLERDSN